MNQHRPRTNPISAWPKAQIRHLRIVLSSIPVRRRRTFGPAGTGTRSRDQTGTRNDKYRAGQCDAEAPTGGKSSHAGGQSETRGLVTCWRTRLCRSKLHSHGGRTGPAARGCGAGDAKALFEIGSRYAEGRGVKADMAKAAEWYEKSAELGFAPAQYRIGNLYEKGIGVARDVKQVARPGINWRPSKGNASAMHNLAVLLRWARTA